MLERRALPAGLHSVAGLEQRSEHRNGDAGGAFRVADQVVVVKAWSTVDFQDRAPGLREWATDIRGDQVDTGQSEPHRRCSASRIADESIGDQSPFYRNVVR